MKRIKNFKIFESREQLKSIVEECQDILLELNDEGFKVNVSFGESPLSWILVEVSRREKFSANDIYKTIERIKDYLGNLGFKIYDQNPISDRYTLRSYLHFTQKFDSNKKDEGERKQERISESNNYKPIVSDIKYDLKDILLELEDDNFKYDIVINDWYRSSNNDQDIVKWISLSINKEGNWNLSEIEDSLIRVVEFLSLKGLYPLFDPKPQTGLETILISNHADIFKNRMHKIPGTQNTYGYDIQFKVDDVI